jgi:cardiolipin synthase A/B
MLQLNLDTILLWFLPPVLLLLAVLAAGHALLNKRDSKSAFGWIALCIILPLAGPVIYLLFGINRVRSRAQREYLTKVSRDSLQTIHDPEDTHFRPLSTVGETLTRKGLSACTSLEILENGEQLYPAMVEAIRSASHRVLLASYIFDNDQSGLVIADALAEAVGRGVTVKVIIDGLGEYMSLPRIGRQLKRRGIEFVRFNPIKLIPPSLNINMRNHRKVLIIDGLIAFTGGQNIGDRHLAARTDNPHRVIDIHFKLQGKIVDELEWTFWQDWYYCRGEQQLQSFRGSNVNNPDARTWGRVVLDGPNKDMDKLSHLLQGVISAAKFRVLIMTPYFLPTFDLIGALIAAHLRGVHVQILLPGYNNIRIAHWAMQNTLRQLLEVGLDIRYQPPPFVHSKLLLIDDVYSLIGSANIDPRSLRLNYELGVELFSADVNATLSRYFEDRAVRANPVSADQLRKRSIPIRIRDSIFWLFSPYL